MAGSDTREGRPGAWPCGAAKVGNEPALDEELRKSSLVMCRSINAQAEFWMKVSALQVRFFIR
ncbi:MULTISPECIES: ParD-like family protein [Pacificibacter]|uniref:ParD-like family protein n=1 Tax=Pacificibacter TaxID=1042323 RepID=UPI002090228F|nr:MULTISPECIES: ParD-like family protein [Pacificibacter]MDO6614738.1 ParD-like family protein [Pacificibacter sp. 1_MG-2023]